MEVFFCVVYTAHVRRRFPVSESRPNLTYLGPCSRQAELLSFRRIVSSANRPVFAWFRLSVGTAAGPADVIETVLAI